MKFSALRTLRNIALVAVLGLAAIGGFAQNRIPIAINATASADPIGQAFVYHLKEALSDSKVFTYNSATRDGFVLNIVATDDKESVQAISVVLTVNDKDGSYYMDQWALRSANPQSGELVRGLLSGLSQDMDIFQKRLSQTREVQ